MRGLATPFGRRHTAARNATSLPIQTAGRVGLPSRPPLGPRQGEPPLRTVRLSPRRSDAKRQRNSSARPSCLIFPVARHPAAASSLPDGPGAPTLPLRAPTRGLVLL